MKNGARDAALRRIVRGMDGSGSSLELLGALAVIAAALLDPFQAAIGVVGLVRPVLVEAGLSARLAGRIL